MKYLPLRCGIGLFRKSYAVKKPWHAADAELFYLLMKPMIADEDINGPNLTPDKETGIGNFFIWKILPPQYVKAKHQQEENYLRPWTSLKA